MKCKQREGAQVFITVNEANCYRLTREQSLNWLLDFYFNRSHLHERNPVLGIWQFHLENTHHQLARQNQRFSELVTIIKVAIIHEGCAQI
jgi:hypothetical protein